MFRKRNKSKLEALYSWASTESTEDKVLRDIIKSFPEDMQITRAETRRVKKKKNKDKDQE